MHPPEEVLAAWQLKGQGVPLGDGHINDTWLVPSADGSAVLQRISGRVFDDPGLVMRNVGRVVTHLNAHHAGWVPELLPTVQGESSFVDAKGNWWRCWHHVAEGRTLSELETLEQAHAAGEAFGRTQRYLADLPGPPLTDTIPGFMRLDHYLREYDGLSDHSQVAAEHAFVSSVRNRFNDVLAEPNAYIHGDCKLNNLLFDHRKPRVCAVLDLDTVMWGHWAWDLGDLVRSAAVRDDRLWIEGYAELVKGFREGSGRQHDALECVLAPQYVCLMLGVRFLTDHLRSDVYFKVSKRGDNLIRARRTFKLLEELYETQDQLVQAL
jgi:aminoglycoside phosphotransferase (APT) family kinase protein